MAYPTIVAMLALLQYMLFSMKVGAARSRYSIEAPATTGDPRFERVFRVHQNTLEQIVVFLPALYAFSVYVHPKWGAVIGIGFLVGRYLYARGYTEDASKRHAGMLVTGITTLILLLGGCIGALLAAG